MMKNLKNFKLTKGSLYWLITFLLLLLGKAMARNDIEGIKYFSTYFFIAGIVMFVVKLSAILYPILKKHLKQPK